MKTLMAAITFCMICTTAQATRPFPPKVFANDSWTFVAGFAWPDDNDKVLIIRTFNRTILLSLEELGIETMNITMSSAGSMWYQNSIGFVTSVKLKGAEKVVQPRVFYFRGKSGKATIVDLNTGKLIQPDAIMNNSDLEKAVLDNAASLVKSDNPKDRQTGAIHLGQVGSSKHLPLLKELLEDKSAHTQISDGKETTVYYVKEVSDKAIKSIADREAAKKDK